VAFDFTKLVTDRTASDFAYWLELRNKGFDKMSATEKTRWETGNMKGAYNAGDLTRVGTALNYLRDRLNTCGYITYPMWFEARTDWNDASIPTSTDLTHYLKCVATIREAIAQAPTTPPTPTDTGALNYNEANDIEKILYSTETLINNMIAALFFCNDLYCGEV
jgi:hypothetical protein